MTPQVLDPQYYKSLVASFVGHGVNFPMPKLPMVKPAPAPKPPRKRQDPVEHQEKHRAYMRELRALYLSQGLTSRGTARMRRVYRKSGHSTTTWYRREYARDWRRGWHSMTLKPEHFMGLDI
jgi:hypothetical protein